MSDFIIPPHGPDPWVTEGRHFRQGAWLKLLFTLAGKAAADSSTKVGFEDGDHRDRFSGRDRKSPHAIVGMSAEIANELVEDEGGEVYPWPLSCSL